MRTLHLKWVVPMLITESGGGPSTLTGRQGFSKVLFSVYTGTGLCGFVVSQLHVGISLSEDCTREKARIPNITNHGKYSLTRRKAC